MLQRVYGTAFMKRAGSLPAHAEKQKSAPPQEAGSAAGSIPYTGQERRGSRVLAPKGWRLFQSLINYMRQRQGTSQLCGSEHAGRDGPWSVETSGHWFSYRENMFHHANRETNACSPSNR